MPFYTMVCPKCGHVEEYLQGANDVCVVLQCANCSADITRRDNRLYAADVPVIQGSTVAGGCNYDGYFDEGLGLWVKSKRHRAEEMKKQGLQEYSPDPEFAKHRDEAKYIRKHAPKGDKEAVTAAREQYKIADEKRKRRAVRSAIQKKRAAIERGD